MKNTDINKTRPLFCLFKPSRFFLPKIKNIVETDLSELDKLYHLALEKKDYYLALALAQQTSIYHGEVGLLNYLDTKIMQLAKSKQENEIIETDCFNTYIYLLLLEKLIGESNDKFLKFNESLQSLKQKLNNLIHLAKFPEADIAAEHIFKEAKNI